MTTAQAFRISSWYTRRGSRIAPNYGMYNRAYQALCQVSWHWPVSIVCWVGSARLTVKRSMTSQALQARYLSLHVPLPMFLTLPEETTNNSSLLPVDMQPMPHHTSTHYNWESLRRRPKSFLSVPAIATLPPHPGSGACGVTPYTSVSSFPNLEPVFHTDDNAPRRCARLKLSKPGFCPTQLCPSGLQVCHRQGQLLAGFPRRSMSSIQLSAQHLVLSQERLSGLTVHNLQFPGTEMDMSVFVGWIDQATWQFSVLK
jgi:hypothetical protein